MEKTTEEVNVQETAPAQKEYHAPDLRDYGTIRELTLSDPPGVPYAPDTDTGYATSYS